jgi:MFS family permease
MKYGNTARTLSLIFHFIIFAAFGALGIYFGFFVTPLYFSKIAGQYTELTGPYNLHLGLSLIGLSLFAISLYGFIEAIFGLLHAEDDAPVVKSFIAFIVDGYVAAAFFLLIALVYFDAVPGVSKNLAFVIVMSLLLAILLLIATNIPMVRLFDGKDQKPLLTGFAYGGAVVGLVLALEFFLSLIGSWSAGVYSYSTQINRILGISAILALIAGGLSLASAILIHRLGEKKPGVLNLASYLASGSVFSTGALLFIAGMVELINKDEPGMHFQKLGSNGAVTGDTAYAIMSIVVGAIVVGVAVFMVISTFQESHKEKPVVKK